MSQMSCMDYLEKHPDRWIGVEEIAQCTLLSRSRARCSLNKLFQHAQKVNSDELGKRVNTKKIVLEDLYGRKGNRNCKIIEFILRRGK